MPQPENGEAPAGNRGSSPGDQRGSGSDTEHTRADRQSALTLPERPKLSAMAAELLSKDRAERSAGNRTAEANVVDRWDEILATAPDVPIVATTEATEQRRMVLTKASDIRPRRVRWLWKDRLALGTLGLLAGREGLGKSSLGYWIAGQITRGLLPGEYGGAPRSVLVCASEDSWEFTIVPRLIAAGANLERVHRVEVLAADDIHVGLSLPRDLHAVERAARETESALLLLDPLMSRLSESLDTHRDGDVRRALEPMVAVADRTGMSVLGLIHHNKSGSSDPLQLVMGSKAFTAVARSVHTVVPDPDDDTDQRRLFGTPKNNLGRTDLPTLSFTISGHPVSTDDGTAWTSHIDWGGEIADSIAETMRRAADSPDDRSAASEAAGWLTDFMAENHRRAASADIRTAGAKAGHNYDALKRAKRKLRLQHEDEGFPRRTYWVSAGHVQSEHSRSNPVRGESLTALTAPTGRQSVQSEQSEQSAGDGGALAPTGAPMGKNSSPRTLSATLPQSSAAQNTVARLGTRGATGSDLRKQDAVGGATGAPETGSGATSGVTVLTCGNTPENDPVSQSRHLQNVLAGPARDCPVCVQPTRLDLVPTSSGPACRKCAPGIRKDTRCVDCGHPRDLVANRRCNPCHGRAVLASGGAA